MTRSEAKALIESEMKSLTNPLSIQGVFVAALLLILFACGTDKRGYVEQGNRHMGKADYRQAEIAYRKAIRKDPELGLAYELLAQAELKQGKYVRGVSSLRRAMVLMPYNVAVRVALADILLPAYFADPAASKRVLQEAKSLSEQLEKAQPTAFNTYRIKAYISLAEGKRIEATDLFRQANLAKPYQTQVVLQLVNLLIAEKQGDEAETVLRQFIEGKSDEPSIYDRLYVYYRSAKRQEEAEALLHRKIAAFPRVPEYRIELAAHYADLRKPAESARALTYLVDHRADFPKVDMYVGDYYVRSGKWDEAVHQYEQGIENEAKEKLTYEKRIFEAYVAQGKIAEANEILDSILKDNPKDAESRVAKATLRLGAADDAEIDAAADDFQALVNESPENPVFRLNLARAHMVTENLEKAKSELRQAIKQNPEFTQARLTLSQAYLETELYKEALEQADDVLSRTSDHPQARLLRISALVGQGNLFTARTELLRLLKDHPQFAAAEVQLAYIDTKEKRFTEADQILRKYYRPGMADLRILRGLANIYVAQGRGDHAIDLLSNEIKVIKEPRMAARIRMILAETATHVGNAEIALQQYEQALPYSRQPAQIHYRISSLHAVQKNTEQSIRHLEQARQLAPENYNILLSLAGMIETQGRLAEAQTLYRKILAAEPENAVALNNLAFNLAESGGNLDEALRLAERAVKHMSGHANFADTLGWIYLKRKNLEPALQIMGNLAQKYPENSTFRYHYALALLEKGDKVRAKQELQAALSTRPTAAEENKIRLVIAQLN